ncbi:protein FAM184A-like [Gigantopelta aegis]|uniref:protein FAM184A-like n=1 Tax=Gigantopelta aegis TaxID=1735272 RepID=UPI001B88CABF|nr:protein FAM184A-like [Gigantopelta aegis]XP_041362488.1 protein FAM184A-like [Gigantopelta aegis]
MVYVSNDKCHSRNEMDKTGRSFEFRMSKKVAELTQVVHMLFTRNHEKEVEIEALKDAYEYEIQLVIADAKQKISALEVELEDAQTQKGVDESKWRSLLNEEMKTREEEWRKKVSDGEMLLQDERNECQNLRDLLINAQKDIEKLRQGVTNQLTYKSEELLKRDTDLEKLKKYVAGLERTVRDSEKENADTVREFERSNTRLEQELTHMHELLEEGHQAREQLMAKNRQLEHELKTLKKEFNRKISEIVSNQNGRAPRIASYANQNDELERLRREVQRYRLELSNRDLNFNRMFTNQQPIFVDQRTGRTKSTKSPLQVQQNGYHPSTPPYVSQSVDVLKGSTNKSLPQSKIVHAQQTSIQMFAREKSHMNNGFTENLTSASGSLSSTPSNPRTVSSQSHLPSITPTSASSEHRARLKTLAKPRPLSKEALFGK